MVGLILTGIRGFSPAGVMGGDKMLYKNVFSLKRGQISFSVMVIFNENKLEVEVDELKYLQMEVVT